MDSDYLAFKRVHKRHYTLSRVPCRITVRQIPSHYVSALTVLPQQTSSLFRRHFGWPSWYTQSLKTYTRHDKLDIAALTYPTVASTITYKATLQNSSLNPNEASALARHGAHADIPSE